MWTNPQETADLVTLTEEILHGKLYFLCSENDIKKSWDVIKGIIGSAKSSKGSIPKRMMNYSGYDIFDQEKINWFNKFFVDIGPKLASIFPQWQTKFDQYLKPHQTFTGEVNLIDGKLKEALRGLKPNKSLTVFLQINLFPVNLRIMKVFLNYKKDEDVLVTNRPINIISSELF